MVVLLKARVGPDARDERLVPQAIRGNQRGCNFAIEDVDRGPQSTRTFHVCLARSNSCEARKELGDRYRPGAPLRLLQTFGVAAGALGQLSLEQRDVTEPPERCPWRRIEVGLEQRSRQRVVALISCNLGETNEGFHALD